MLEDIVCIYKKKSFYLLVFTKHSDFSSSEQTEAQARIGENCIDMYARTMRTYNTYYLSLISSFITSWETIVFFSPFRFLHNNLLT